MNLLIVAVLLKLVNARNTLQRIYEINERYHNRDLIYGDIREFRFKNDTKVHVK